MDGGVYNALGEVLQRKTSMYQIFMDEDLIQQRRQPNRLRSQ